jgi:hypothetical protein
VFGYESVDFGNSDVAGIKVTTTRGVALTGRVVIEGQLTTNIDPNLKMTVRLRRDPDIVSMPAPVISLPQSTANPQRPIENGQVLPDGSFKILAALGDFQVDVNGIPAKSYVKSIRMGNVDIMSGGLQISGAADNPIDVVIGTDGGEVTGTANNDRLEGMANVVVALIPESPLLRRRYDLYRNATTDIEGKFRLPNVPPGTYKLFSWDYVDANSWQDAQFLQPYETVGKNLTVREGSTQEAQVKVTPVRR